MKLIKLECNDSIPSRRAIEFFGLSKIGKKIDELLQGNWNGNKIINFLDSLSDSEYIGKTRTLANWLSIYDQNMTGAEFETNLLRVMEPLYKDWTKNKNNVDLKKYL